MKAEKLKW